MVTAACSYVIFLLLDTKHAICTLGDFRLVVKGTFWWFCFTDSLVIQCNVVGLHIYCLRLCVYYSGIYGHQESAYDGFKS